VDEQEVSVMVNFSIDNGNMTKQKKKGQELAGLEFVKDALFISYQVITKLPCLGNLCWLREQ